jgi:hypothetical protein
MAQEFRRAQASGQNEKADRAARVERMAFVQKLKAFHHELTAFRERTAPEDMEAEWPEDQLDEAYDLMDRIQGELTVFIEALKEVE